MAVVVTLVLGGAGLLAFLAAPIPVILLVLAVTAVLVRGIVPLVPAFHRKEWIAILRLAAVYSAATAIGTVYVYAAVIATSLVASEQESGYFAASFRIFLILLAVPSLLIATAFPVLARAARDDRERLSYALQRLFDIAVIVGCWLALITVLGAPLAIEILAGDNFEASVPVLRIYGLATAFACVALTFGYVLVSIHRHAVLLVAAIAALTISIGLTVALVPVVGAEGGAVATLVVEAVIAVFYAWALFARGDFKPRARHRRASRRRHRGRRRPRVDPGPRAGAAGDPRHCGVLRCALGARRSARGGLRGAEARVEAIVRIGFNLLFSGRAREERAPICAACFPRSSAKSPRPR